MNPRIAALRDTETTEAAARILRRVKAALGMAPNLHRTLAHSPAALEAYVSMANALGGGVLSPALRESVAVATAAHHGCSYCASAHTALGKQAGVPDDELRCNLGFESSDPRTAAALAFVRVILVSRGAISDAQLEDVRNAGFSDAEIVELVAHVGLNTFTNVFNVLARTEIDFPPVALAEAG